VKPRREVGLVLRALRQDLEPWQDPRTLPLLTVDVPVPPLNTEVVYAGVPIARLLVPDCHLSPRALAEAFSLFVWWVLDGAPPEYAEDATPGLPAPARKFIGASPIKFVLWACTGADLELALDPDKGVAMALGETTFGLADGMIYSDQKNEAFVFDASVLSEQRVIRSREPGFRALWNKARNSGRREAAMALAALLYARVAGSSRWRTLVPWVMRPDLKSDCGAADIIANAEDPLASLYLLLVPDRMSKKVFEARLGRLADRPFEPSNAYRDHLWAAASRLKIT
jgi:hypothetical protein